MSVKSHFSSGETALATTTDAPVNAIVRPVNGFFKSMKNLMVVNEGAAAGFVTIDGETWIRVPAQETIILRSMLITATVQIKRPAGGTDMSGVFVSIW